MSHQPEVAASGLIRDGAVMSRLGGLFAHVSPARHQEFMALVGGIWKTLEKRLSNLLATRDSNRRRSVTVLGLIRRDGLLGVRRLGTRHKHLRPEFLV